MKKNSNKLSKIACSKKNVEKHNISTNCWVFYCLNDGKDVDGGSPQIMRCMYFYTNHVHAPIPSTKKGKKNLITYYKTYGITTLKKLVDADHFLIFEKNKEEINS
jgi:hypothetical protein